MSEVKFSVLMSVYKKEKPQYFAECMESLLSQTVTADEIVLVEDGPLTPELYDMIDRYSKKCNMDIVKNQTNLGLGRALARGIKHCSHNLVARMDTDDIAVRDRFEKQLKFFKNNSQLDILGGYIEEFSGNVSNITGERQVPLTQAGIYHYQRQRDAFNHMTVMYKRDAVLKAGNYKHCLLMEDSLLWANMIKNHARMANLGETLVYARTGEDMLQRRGGFDYFLKYRRGRKQILKTGTISHWDYVFTVMVQFVVCMVPLPVRRFIFNTILRK